MVRIVFTHDYLELQQGVWTPSTPQLSSLAKVANTFSQEPFYSYSPSHGAYGVLMAHQIVEKIGGKVEVEVGEGEGGEPLEGVVL